jgi:1-deoxy-D-xylulose-5-phosphate reductoisomerase
LGTPDMRTAIQYALTYPTRLPRAQAKKLDLVEIGKLHFEKMDYHRFRCLAFAFDAGKVGGSMPTVLNAANEAAVAAFLNGQISFLQIEDLIEKAMQKHELIQLPELDAIRQIDRETRLNVHRFINE